MDAPRQREILASSGAFLFAAATVFVGCTTLPTPQVPRYKPPKGAIYERVPKRPLQIIGLVRTRVGWPSLVSPNDNEDAVCKNYYYKGVGDLLALAQKNGADGVLQPRSVTFDINGKMERFSTPECSDDGEEGQILLQGLAFRWRKPGEAPSPIPDSLQPESPRPPRVVRTATPLPEPEGTPAPDSVLYESPAAAEAAASVPAPTGGAIHPAAPIAP